VRTGGSMLCRPRLSSRRVLLQNDETRYGVRTQSRVLHGSTAESTRHAGATPYHKSRFCLKVAERSLSIS